MKYTGRTYTGFIFKRFAKPHEIMCFGSNTEGRHGLGTAKICKDDFGAIYGQASGLQGQSWGLVTTDLNNKKKGIIPSVPKDLVLSEVKKLYDFAIENTQYDFKIMYQGLTNKNLSGWTNDQFAEFFSAYPIPSNIIFEKQFSTLLNLMDIGESDDPIGTQCMIDMGR